MPLGIDYKIDKIENTPYTINTLAEFRNINFAPDYVMCEPERYGSNVFKKTLESTTDITADDNDGTVIVVSVDGKWYKYELQHSSKVAAKWFGMTKSRPDNHIPIQNAIDYANLNRLGDVLLPAWTFYVSGEIVVKNNTNLIGQGRGYGNVNIKTLMISTYDGITLNIASYYCKLQDFMLKAKIQGSTGDASIDVYKGTAIYAPVTYLLIENVTLMHYDGYTGFEYAIRTHETNTTFSHTLRNVSIFYCKYGVYARHHNNMTIDNCFFDSNKYTFDFETCSQMAIVNGTVFQILDRGPGAEDNTSYLLKASQINGLVIRDWYAETSSEALQDRDTKLFVLGNISGGGIFSGYNTGNLSMDASKSFIEIDGDTVEGFEISNNRFYKTPDNAYTIKNTGTTKFMLGVIIRNNTTSSLGKIFDNTFSPEIDINSDKTGITYSKNVGEYYISESGVKLSGLIRLSNKGTNTGNVRLVDIPSPKNNIGTDMYLKGDCFIEGKVIDYDVVAPVIRTGQSYAYLRKMTQSSRWSGVMTDADFNNDSVIYFNFEYRV